MKENILVTICARSGSKGVKGKNIRELYGKPLLAYTIEHAKSWSRTTHLYISTDSSEIAAVAKQSGVTVSRLRDVNLAGDTVGKLDVIQDAVQWAEKESSTNFDYVIDLDVTAPLRRVEDIEGVYQVLKNKSFDVVFSVCEARRNPYFNLVELDEQGRAQLSKRLSQPILSRQNAPSVYELNASIYGYRRSFLKSNPSSCITPNSGIFLMPTERSWDIDHEEDFAIVETLLERFGSKKAGNR